MNNRYFLFNTWTEDLCGYNEILVAANSYSEAEKKLYKTDLDFDDYSFEEEVFYDDVVL